MAISDEPINLDRLAEQLRGGNGETPRKKRRSVRLADGRPAQSGIELALPDPKAINLAGDAAELFLGLANRYKAAQEQNKLTAWQGVRDYIMEHFDGLVMTRLVSFRDLMNAAVDIDQKILKGREDLKTDPLALYEKWWTKPDVEASQVNNDNGPPPDQTQD